MDEGGGALHVGDVIGPGKSEEGLVDAVFRILGEGPPHGDGVLDERPVVRLAEGERHRLSTGHVNGLLLQFQVAPLAVMQVPIALDGLAVEVDVVVDEHGDAPGMVACVADGGEGESGEVVAVVLDLRADDVGLVPHRWLGVAHVRVVAEDHLAAGGPVSPDDPGVGPQPLRDGAQRIHLVDERGDARDVRLGSTGRGDIGSSGHGHRGHQRIPPRAGRRPGVGDAGEPVRPEGQVRHVGRIEILLHPVEDGLGLQVDGKRVRHEAGGAVDVVGVERLGVLAEEDILQWGPVLFDEAVDAGEVGGHAVLDALGAVGEEFRRDAVGRLAHAEGAQILIVGHHVFSEQGGQLPAPGPAQQVHLPEALGRVDVSQGVQGIGFVLCVDVGDGHVIKDDLHGGRHSAGGDVEFIVRSMGVDERDEATDQEDHDDAQGDEGFLHGAKRRGGCKLHRPAPDPVSEPPTADS